MSYIGQGLPADVFGAYTVDTFTGDGSATTFTLSKAPTSDSALIVVVDNVIQQPTTNFTVSGTTLTIVGTAILSGIKGYAIHTQGKLPVGTATAVDTNGASDGIVLDTDGDTTISADTDDQIDFKAGGTDVMSMTATGLTINDGVEITTADNTDTLTLTSTDADANSGPNLRLYRNSSSPAVNDVIGVIDIEGRNDNSEDIVYQQYRHLIADETDGTEDGYLLFHQMKAGTLTERYRVETGTFVINDPGNDFDFRVETQGSEYGIMLDASTNEVGIGVNPSRSFHTQASANDVIVMHHNTATSGNVYGLQIDFSSTVNDSTSYFIRCMGNDRATQRFLVFSNGNVESATNSYGSTSDERIKQDITDANSQWDDIKNLKVRNFKFKEDVKTEDAGGQKANTYLGLVAQEVESVSPGLVKLHDPSPSDIASNSAFGTLYTDGDELPDGRIVGDVKEVKEQVKSVSYSVLYMKAVKALQEAMAKIETLETKVKALEDA